MRRIGRFISRRHDVPLLLAAGICLIAAVLLMFAMVAISPLSGTVFRSLTVWSKGLMPFLNLLPLFLLMLLLYFITSSLGASIMPVAFVALAMAVTNRIKLTLRGDPLQHWDLSLISEVLGIIRGFGTRPILIGVALILLFLAISVVVTRCFRTVKLSRRARAIGGAVTAAVLLLCNATLYTSSALEASLPVWGSFYNQADVHNSKGNLYSFLYGWNRSRSAQPAGYSKQETRLSADAKADALETALPNTLPNIIIIMGEAFSDLSESAAVDFTGFRDPLESFKRMGEEGILGHIVVPSRGGGTADTENDVLTAQPARFQRNAPYAYRSIVAACEAMPAMLASEGYDAFALHPGYAWFYNRQNIYPYLGFASCTFEDAFAPDAYRDTFISEEATFDMLLSLIEERIARDSLPMMGFCLTIQNHAAYHDRFLPSGVETFSPTVPMTADQRNTLSNYFHGISEADDALSRLKAYLDAQEEPFIVLYYGDHLPALEEALYDLLIPGADAEEGSYLQETRLNTVPFLIWQNAAAQAQHVLREDLPGDGLPESRTISSSYLGAYLLRLLGLDSLSAYWQETATLLETYPILMEHIAYAADGSAVKIDASDTLRSYRNWVYYRTHGD